MRQRRLLSAILCVELLLATSRPAAVAAPGEDDRRMVALVASRIFAEAEPVQGWAWPPLVAISDKDDVNAFATITSIKAGATPDVKDEGNLAWIDVPAAPTDSAGELGADDAANGSEADDVGKPVDDPANDSVGHHVEKNKDGTVTQPIIVLYQGFLDKIVQGKGERLAAVFGHETSHILLRHVDAAKPGAMLVANIITRQQEADADVLGMKLGLAADFPYKGLVAGILAMRADGNYNSFEGLNYDHPSWTDRVALIDSKQTDLWHSISAFENGVYFLTAEQYKLAEDCFNQVTRECPKCYEAWANLGYARLMQYCDLFELDDLRDLDVGQLVVGGFYRRPESLEGPTRGIDQSLWLDAVGALKQAIILNPDLVLAKANLAAAYLISPEGKDVGHAEELFAQVTDALKSGAVEHMEPLVRASLLVNAGVGEMESGDQASAEALFAEAQQLFAAGEAPVDGSAAIVSALHYNRGRMYAAAGDDEQRRAARDELEAYLTGASSAANWWPLAYEQYQKLCAASDVRPKTQDALSQSANRLNRLVTGVTLPDGTTITLNAASGDTLSALDAALGKAYEREIVKKSNIRRLTYSRAGVELLAANQIVAIRLTGPKAPPVVIRASGPGGAAAEVRPGMTLAELEGVLGGDAGKWDQRSGTSAQVVYRFYTRLGFGVRLAGDKITEIIVAQIPVDAKVQ
jgi:Zn-dependent protease with chaperone function